MQVVSGVLRGLRLDTPRDNTVRPTLGHVKEAFFNIIQNDILEANFLDIFSGTAQIGIEALSRGANNCVFVDKDIQLTQQNIEKIKQNFIYKLINKDAQQALQMLQGICFDFIYIDPPYSFTNIQGLFKNINDYKLLTENGIVVLEQNIKVQQINYNGFVVTKTKNYGKTRIVFYAEAK